MKNVLIVGATSAIAEAAARLYAARGDRLYLVARDPRRLEALASDLRIRGAKAIHTALFAAEDWHEHEALVDAVWERLGHLDVALIAHGVLSDQEACDADPCAAAASVDVNASSIASIAGWIARRLEAQGSGQLGIISSVAGDRGRRSNYTYGAAKAFVSAYASGLRHRLHSKNVGVTLIKPGFVDTPMTASFEKGPLWTSAGEAGARIVKALDGRAYTVYVPAFWRWIMLVVRLLPERIFLRTRL